VFGPSKVGFFNWPIYRPGFSPCWRWLSQASLSILLSLLWGPRKRCSLGAAPDFYIMIFQQTVYRNMGTVTKEFGCLIKGVSRLIILDYFICYFVEPRGLLSHDSSCFLGT